MRASPDFAFCCTCMSGHGHALGTAAWLHLQDPAPHMALLLLPWSYYQGGRNLCLCVYSKTAVFGDAVNQFPSEEVRKALGERIDLTEQQVQVC